MRDEAPADQAGALDETELKSVERPSDTASLAPNQYVSNPHPNGRCKREGCDEPLPTHSNRPRHFHSFACRALHRKTRQKGIIAKSQKTRLSSKQKQGLTTPFLSDLGSYVRAQIVAQKDQPNPIYFTTPWGDRGRVWLACDAKGKLQIGDAGHWRVNVGALLPKVQVLVADNEDCTYRVTVRYRRTKNDNEPRQAVIERSREPEDDAGELLASWGYRGRFPLRMGDGPFGVVLCYGSNRPIPPAEEKEEAAPPELVLAKRPETKRVAINSRWDGFEGKLRLFLQDEASVVGCGERSVTVKVEPTLVNLLNRHTGENQWILREAFERIALKAVRP
jgi:hypothetical protein